MRAESCPCCHVDDYEVVRTATHGYIAVCCECGYARPVTVELLLAG